jgi:hypothetical protein
MADLADSFYAAVAGRGCSALSLYVPNVGAWVVEAFIPDGLDALDGSVVVTLGELTLIGTIDPDGSGVERGRQRLRIVAGGNGWGTILPAQGYANAAGITARNVAADAAAAVGETLGTFEPEETYLSDHYVRQTAPASRALESAIGAVPWWVAYDGTTQVQLRAESTPAADAYEVLDYDPGTRLAQLSVDDLSAIGIGSLIEVEDGARAIRDLTIHARDNDLRVEAWLGGAAGERSRLVRGLRTMVGKIRDERLHGVWRYRVSRFANGLADLEPLDDTLPSLLQVQQWPGCGGAQATLATDAVVLVEFLDGRRDLPQVRGFAPGAVERTSINGDDLPVARQGDLVQSGGVGTVVTFGSPPPTGGGPSVPMYTNVPFLISFDGIPPTAALAAPLYGAVTTGAQKLRTGSE